MSWYRLPIGLLLVVPSVTEAQGESAQLLLDFVRDAHRASREAIRTCSCRVEFTTTLVHKTPPVVQSCTAQCWHSPDAVRVKVLETDRELDYVWKDNVRKEVIRRTSNGQTVIGATRGHFTNKHLHKSDAWEAGLLVLNSPGTIWAVPFERLVTDASLCRRIERRRINGKEMIAAELFFDQSKDREGSWIVEVFFDPAANFLVRKTIYTMVGGDLRREAETSEFQECAPGVFFPRTIAGTTEASGKVWATHSTKITDVRINERIPAEMFILRYPHGVVLTDDIRGTSYRVDRDGNPISKENALARIAPPPLAATSAAAPRTETHVEPESWTRWILPLSVAGLAFACLLLVLRRRHRVTPD